MSVELIYLPAFNNVLAAGLANLDLSPLFGYSIENLYLGLGGTTFTKAMMSTIQLKANGKVIVDTTGSATDSRMQFRGLQANANFLTIDFAEQIGRTKNAFQSGLFDTTLGIKNLKIEVLIAGATAPTLSAWASVNPPQTDAASAAFRPLIARVHRVQQTIGAAGKFPIFVPHMDPNAGGSIFKRIHFFSANMTALQVLRNGVYIHDSQLAQNSFRQQYEGKRVPQASLYTFDPIVNNMQEGNVFDTRAAAGCQTALVYGTFSAGETITVEVEVLEPLDVY